MPFGYDSSDSWLRDDDEFDRYNKPGSPDWFSLSDDVSWNKPNNRHDGIKVESLLGYGGYMDVEKTGGPLGLSPGRLEEPIKKFQEKNGLKVDGLLKPGGPTITKMKQLYGGAFGKAPAPTPAMVDADAWRRHEGEESFLYDKGPKFELKPNRRLDGKAHLMEFERWNREWARGSGHVPESLAPEYEGYIRDLHEEHGHDAGLIFARDLTKQVERYHDNGSALAKRLVTLLSDRPDLQRAYLGGEVPKAPPVGTFKPDGEAGVKAWIDEDRVAKGLKPKFAIPAAQDDAPVLRTSSGSQPAPDAQPDPKNLLEYGPNFGLPEDWALEQQAAQNEEHARRAIEATQSKAHAENPAPTPPPGEGGAGWHDPNQMNPEGSHRRRKPDNSRGFEDEFPHPSQHLPDGPPRAPRQPSTGEGGAGWYDPNQMNPEGSHRLPKPPKADAVATQPERPASRPEPRTRTNQQLEIDLENAQSALDARNVALSQRIQGVHAATAAREAKEAEIKRQFGEDVLKGAVEGAAEAALKVTAEDARRRRLGTGGRGRGEVLRDLLFGGIEGAVGASVPPQARHMKELEDLRTKEREALRLQELELVDRRGWLERRDEIVKEREARRNIRPDQ
jgi:hypothetical protein